MLFLLQLQIHWKQTIIALNPTLSRQSLCVPPYTGLLGTWLTLSVNHLLLTFPVYKSFLLLNRQIRTVTLGALY